MDMYNTDMIINIIDCMWITRNILIYEDRSTPFIELIDKTNQGINKFQNNKKPRNNQNNTIMDKIKEIKENYGINKITE